MFLRFTINAVSEWLRTIFRSGDQSKKNKRSGILKWGSAGKSNFCSGPDQYWVYTVFSVYCYLRTSLTLENDIFFDESKQNLRIGTLE